METAGSVPDASPEAVAGSAVGSVVGTTTGSGAGVTVASAVGTGDGTAVDAGAELVADTGAGLVADTGADPNVEGVTVPGSEDVARHIKIAAIPATQHITAMTIKILFLILLFILTPVPQSGCGSDHLRVLTRIPIVPHFNHPRHSKFYLHLQFCM